MGMKTVIRNVRPLGRKPSDVLIVDGTIDVIFSQSIDAPPDADIIDGGGRLLFPGFVDAHTHMDKTLMGLGWHRHEIGPGLLDKIEHERALRKREGIDAHQQSLRHARAAIATGTTHIRTHVDIDGLPRLHGDLCW